MCGKKLNHGWQLVAANIRVTILPIHNDEIGAYVVVPHDRKSIMSVHLIEAALSCLATSALSHQAARHC